MSEINKEQFLELALESEYPYLLVTPSIKPADAFGLLQAFLMWLSPANFLSARTLRSAKGLAKDNPRLLWVPVRNFKGILAS